MADMIDEQLASLRAELPDLPTDFWRRIERQWRDIWGGDRHYVAVRAAQGKALRLGAAIASGDCASLADAFDQAGVSRRWGYRLLARRR